jgi:hypothetical protein
VVDSSIDFAIKYYPEWLRQKHGCNIVRVMQKSTNTLRIRLTAISLALSGIFFILYPAIRPFSDELFLQGAEAFSSFSWVLARSLAMIALI